MRIHSRLLLTVFAAACLSAAPVMAQDADLRGLSEQLERLNNDIKDIQLFIFRSEGPAPSILETGAALEQSAGSEIAGRLEIRFGEVEDQFRTLTGSWKPARRWNNPQARRLPAGLKSGSARSRISSAH